MTVINNLLLLEFCIFQPTFADKHHADITAAALLLLLLPLLPNAVKFITGSLFVFLVRQMQISLKLKERSSILALQIWKSF